MIANVRPASDDIHTLSHAELDDGHVHDWVEASELYLEGFL